MIYNIKLNVQFWCLFELFHLKWKLAVEPTHKIILIVVK